MVAPSARAPGALVDPWTDRLNPRSPKLGCGAEGRRLSEQEPESLTLRYLRRIDGKPDALREDMAEG